MSAYLNFYMKIDNDKYFSLYDWSRNSAVFEYGSKYALWEKCIPLTTEVINYIIEDISQELQNEPSELARIESRKESILKMNNSVEEKEEALDDLNDTLTEVKSISKELEQTKFFYELLEDLILSHTGKYSKENFEEEDFLWFGMEASAPNLEYFEE